jgi:hypothetical protein
MTSSAMKPEDVTRLVSERVNARDAAGVAHDQFLRALAASSRVTGPVTVGFTCWC